MARHGEIEHADILREDFSAATVSGPEAPFDGIGWRGTLVDCVQPQGDQGGLASCTIHGPPYGERPLQPPPITGSCFIHPPFFFFVLTNLFEHQQHDAPMETSPIKIGRYPLERTDEPENPCSK